MHSNQTHLNICFARAHHVNLVPSCNLQQQCAIKISNQPMKKSSLITLLGHHDCIYIYVQRIMNSSSILWCDLHPLCAICRFAYKANELEPAANLFTHSSPLHVHISKSAGYIRMVFMATDHHHHHHFYVCLCSLTGLIENHLSSHQVVRNHMIIHGFINCN